MMVMMQKTKNENQHGLWAQHLQHVRCLHSSHCIHSSRDNLRDRLIHLEDRPWLAQQKGGYRYVTSVSLIIIHFVFVFFFIITIIKNLVTCIFKCGVCFLQIWVAYCIAFVIHCFYYFLEFIKYFVIIEILC